MTQPYKYNIKSGSHCKQIENFYRQSATLQYRPKERHLMTASYILPTFARIICTLCSHKQSTLYEAACVFVIRETVHHPRHFCLENLFVIMGVREPRPHCKSKTAPRGIYVVLELYTPAQISADTRFKWY
jgi:hypothetical protein